MAMLTEKQAITRARRGAAFLDKKFGSRGWRRRIRRRDLHMESGMYQGQGDCGCILAQLYGEYDAETVGLTEHKAAVLGFVAAAEPYSKNYERLTSAWKKVLREPTNG